MVFSFSSVSVWVTGNSPTAAARTALARIFVRDPAPDPFLNSGQVTLGLGLGLGSCLGLGLGLGLRLGLGLCLGFGLGLGLGIGLGIWLT